MAVDYATLKKGGFMRQKQKNNFSLRLRTVGGHMSAEQLAKVAEVAEKYGEGYSNIFRSLYVFLFNKLCDV